VVVAETGKPLYRARIHLSGAMGDASFSRDTFADRDGRYRFENVPPGRYRIQFSRPGFVEGWAGKRHLNDFGMPQEIGAGQIQQFDFALSRGSVISGRVTDDLGEPLPGIQLVPLRVQYSFSGVRLLPWYSSLGSRTDDRGQFRLAALPPGTYVLAADAQNSATGDGYAATYYPGTRNLNEARRVRIGTGDDVTADFSLTATRQVRVTGQVRLSNGAPVQSYSVALRTETTVGNRFGRVTGPAGTFEFDGVSPGRYLLHVNSTRPYDPKETPAEFATMPIEIGDEDVNGVLIVTGFGTTVSGRVIFDGTAPRNSTTQRAYVVPRVVENGYGGRMPPTKDNGLISDAGTFTLRGLTGRVLFGVFMPEWELKSVMLDGVDITDVPYDTSRGGTDKLEIILTDQRQELRGRVVDRFGRTPVEFVVLAFPRNLAEGIPPGRRTSNNFTSNTDGSFIIQSLVPGDYFAAALKSLPESARYDPEFHDSIKDRATPFVISPGQTVKLDLTLIE
jgi:hypothetical protein